ncbi:hypothetical protein [Endozoicomonas numazuensis]|uniref:hypothetical protein n=1 Tax=Endozoicomonas numazuensis TaxID=1137799 RepID=UPI0012684A20|nr:hypothetical protein [Endozoicomonas numazuensis]
MNDFANVAGEVYLAMAGPGGKLKAGKKIVELVNKLPRYTGIKPKYHVNKAHVKGSKEFNTNKTPLPDDAADVYKRSVPDDPVNARHWYGLNKNGVIYRFSNANDGTMHFSGRSDSGNGIRSITKYAEQRLRDL